ncbi:MAG: hypothetical protein JWN79_2945 [Gemmatimonadetes bacterium]|jgi:hypothetical protein|nr:hypothetical protein [Gemmatimonadota bacterium]
MSDREQDGSTRRNAPNGNDTEEALQNELRREAGEGRGSVGDVSSNRNLSGSSTWETMMDPPAGNPGEHGEVM